MQSGRLFAILSLIAPVALPTAVLAQGGAGAQLFTSFDSSLPGDGMAGFGLSLGTGSLALRGSFGLSYSTFSTATDPAVPKEPSRWTGDADLVIPDGFFGLSSLFGGALHPYGFVGIGARSIASSPTVDDATKTWSYGGGASIPLGSALSIQGEVRTRTQLGTNILTTPGDFTGGTEFRVGLDFKLGSGRSSGSGARFPSGGGRTSSGGGTVWPAGNNAAGAARRVVPRGERYVGVPYVWGGETPKGFDCSGFVQYVYRAEGVELPRTSRQMAGSGFGVSRSDMAIGDLMLFADNGPISHVAIYAGNGRFIHSSSSGNGVRYDDLNSGRGAWYSQNLVAVRRVATGSGAAIAAFAQSLIPFEGFDPPDKAPRVKK
jgi:cell wall-associated NlpC family hydrolase